MGKQPVDLIHWGMVGNSCGPHPAFFPLRFGALCQFLPQHSVILQHQLRCVLQIFRNFQVGAVHWQGDKVVKGVIIRHLILPGHVDNSLKVLDWIGSAFAPGEVLVSLMRQYTPMGNLPAPLDRRVTDEEYDAVLSWMYLNDLEGFTQEGESADTAFIPDF